MRCGVEWKCCGASGTIQSLRLWRERLHYISVFNQAMALEKELGAKKLEEVSSLSLVIAARVV